MPRTGPMSARWPTRSAHRTTRWTPSTIASRCTRCSTRCRRGNCGCSCCASSATRPRPRLRPSSGYRRCRSPGCWPPRSPGCARACWPRRDSRYLTRDERMVGGQPVPGKRLAPPWRAHEADPVMAVPRPEHAKPGGSASPGGPASQHFRGTMTVAADEPSASQDDRYSDAVAVFTELTRALAEDESVPETLQSILALVLRLVPGCHAASVTVLDEKGVPGTIAATGEETYQMDRRQYELHDGPCLDAARHQQVNRWNLAEAEQRWPDFTRLAKEMGLRSYLSTGLGWAGRPLGALNLSSRDADGFDQLDERLMSLFTAPAAAAIVVARRYSEARGLAAQLEQALLSRAVIDQAIGIIMAESRCNAAAAFAALGRASNNRNMKLRDLAAEIVTRVGGPPSARPAE